jgi:hypothetical protein
MVLQRVTGKIAVKYSRLRRTLSAAFAAVRLDDRGGTGGGAQERRCERPVRREVKINNRICGSWYRVEI